VSGLNNLLSIFRKRISQALKFGDREEVEAELQDVEAKQIWLIRPEIQ